MEKMKSTLFQSSWPDLRRCLGKLVFRAGISIFKMLIRSEATLAEASRICDTLCGVIVQFVIEHGKRNQGLRRSTMQVGSNMKDSTSQHALVTTAPTLGLVTNNQPNKSLVVFIIHDEWKFEPWTEKAAESSTKAKILTNLQNQLKDSVAYFDENEHPLQKRGIKISSMSKIEFRFDQSCYRNDPLSLLPQLRRRPKSQRALVCYRTKLASWLVCCRSRKWYNTIIALVSVYFFIG